MSIIVLDTSNMRIKLTKTAVDITKFKLYAHSFIKIDVISGTCIVGVDVGGVFYLF